jgi:predicted nucleic acid-binding protein
MFRDTAGFDLQMSAVSLAEVLVHPARAGKADKFLKLIDGLGLEIVPIEESDSAKLAKLRASTNLKMPDCLVLHQALKASGSIATTDKTLARVSKEKVLGFSHPKFFSDAVLCWHQGLELYQPSKPWVRC